MTVDVEVVGKLTPELFLTSCITSVFEIIFGIGECWKPIADYNNQNTASKIQISDLFCYCKDRITFRRIAKFWCILSMALPASIYATRFISNNPLPLDCAEEKLVDVIKNG